MPSRSPPSLGFTSSEGHGSKKGRRRGSIIEDDEFDSEDSEIQIVKKKNRLKIPGEQSTIKFVERRLLKSAEIDQALIDEQLLLCTPLVKGYCLKNKKWGAS